MKAADVMVTNVITVGPDACVQDVAHTLLSARISGWLALFTGKEVLAAEFIREHSRKVTDVMTREVVTAAPDTPLSKIATLLEKNAIKRVPIVEGSKVVGIVSRANLLQALASLSKQVEVATEVNDSQIREGRSSCGGLWSLHRRRKLSESPPRSPPACAPSTTISSFVRRSGDTERNDLRSGCRLGEACRAGLFRFKGQTVAANGAKKLKPARSLI